MESALLDVVRKAVARSERHHLAQQNTNERKQGSKPQAAAVHTVELLPKAESDAIMEKLVSKMVERPTTVARERE